jgi:Zn-dependent alcohol dehydrogenase
MRMKAAVLFEQGLPAPYSDSQPFHVEDVELDGPGEGEVLVEVIAAGLCHSDLSIVAGMRKRAVPAVGGHEGAGIVREFGRGVHGLRPGDHVVMTTGAGCGHCASCANQRPVLCDKVTVGRAQGSLPNGARRLRLNGKSINHYSGISSFAQFAVTASQSLVRADKSVPLNIAAVFGCAVVTGVGVVFNAAKVRPGQSIAVLGLGGVGLNTVMAAKLSGASHIIGIDVNKAKFALAEDLGCTATILASDEDAVPRIRDLTSGGVDYAFEMSGARSAMKTAIEITRKGGEIICVGMGATGDIYEYPQTMLIAEEKVIRGSIMGSAISDRDIPLYLRLYSEGKLPVDRLVSGTIEFGDINRNLDMLHGGSVLRQILLPNGQGRL